jgi:uncharacterized protein YndB with AHSA1/START domain
MNHVRTTVQIRRPAEEVFDFVTTPAHWPRWHPASLGVEGATDHPLELGEQVTEDFSVAGRRGRAVWTVRRRERPQLWSIDGEAADGSRATITYTLAPAPDGTTFRRDVSLAPADPGLDWSLLGPVIEQESAEALRRLRDLLEAGD